MDSQPRLTPSEILAKPAMTWSEFWLDLLGLPETTAEQLTREAGAPPFFLLGRRRYIRRDDAIAWIDAKAESDPYVPRRNNRKARGARHNSAA